MPSLEVRRQKCQGCINKVSFSHLISQDGIPANHGLLFQVIMTSQVSHSVPSSALFSSPIPKIPFVKVTSCWVYPHLAHTPMDSLSSVKLSLGLNTPIPPLARGSCLLLLLLLSQRSAVYLLSRRESTFPKFYLFANSVSSKPCRISRVVGSLKIYLEFYHAILGVMWML